MTSSDALDPFAAARAWARADPDPITRDQLLALADAGDEADLRERLEPLRFGTAGLRGVVGAGPGRMNLAVVRRTTRGLADHLLAEVPEAAERGVIVGFDGRVDSERFAREAVGVLAAAGLAVRWFPTPQPTPLVAYTQKALKAAAAVVITASHNPPADNGYKVYVHGAAQIVPPTGAAIAAAIAAAGPANEIEVADPVTSPRIAPVEAEVVDRYLVELAAARPHAGAGEGSVRLVHTAMHGVGSPLVARALTEAGHTDLHPVTSQAEPDGAFPTVAFPNPEEPGALDAALALAREVEAELILANDPDADRLAVAVRDPSTSAAGGYRVLTGNELGVLLADHLLAGGHAPRPLTVASIVSSPMAASVAEAHDANHEWTLTGFKWIAAAARELEREAGRSLVYGFEEALGSSVGTVVADKDGIGAAVVVADLAATLAASGRSLLDQLETLWRTHGLWVSHQHSITREGADGQAAITDAMAVLDDHRPDQLAGHPVTGVTDYRTGAERRPAWLGATDLVEFSLDDGRAMIRPSGTEPKVKIYVDLRAELTDAEHLHSRREELLAAAAEVATDLARFVGLRG